MEQAVQMAMSIYRFRAAATVAIREQNGFRLKEISAGSVFLAASREPDHNGMFSGTTNGDSVLIFRRDLEERAEAVGLERLQAALAT